MNEVRGPPDESEDNVSLNSDLETEENYEHHTIPLNDTDTKGKKDETKKPVSLQSLVSMPSEEKSLHGSGLSLEGSIASSVWTEEPLDESERSEFSLSDRFTHPHQTASPTGGARDAPALGDSGAWEEVSENSGEDAHHTMLSLIHI